MAWSARGARQRRRSGVGDPLRELHAPRFLLSPRNSSAASRAVFPPTSPRSPTQFVAAQAQKAETIATRKASQQAIEAFAAQLPEMIGGSADLTGSVFTNWSGSIGGDGERQPGNYVNYGVREFAMAAIANGLALHGGFIPYVGTFLTFSDYMRNAVRMAALMKLRAIFVFTHDSIGLGEDGPTHQSIEHAASLRLIPQLDVWRPCDTVETAVAWAQALERSDGPSALLFTRQNVAFATREPRSRRRHRARRLRARRFRRRPRCAARRRHRHRLRSAAGARRARSTRARMASPCASCRCRARSVRPSGRRVPRAQCCRTASRGSPSRPERPTGGANTSAPSTIPPRASSASTATANPRRHRRCSSISALPSNMSRKRCATWWRRGPDQ